MSLQLGEGSLSSTHTLPFQLLREESNNAKSELSSSFEAKLSATQAYFEESLTERDSQVEALQATVRRQQEELHLRDQDMMQLFRKHETDVQQLHDSLARGDARAATAVLRQQLQASLRRNLHTILRFYKSPHIGYYYRIIYVWKYGVDDLLMTETCNFVISKFINDTQ